MPKVWRLSQGWSKLLPIWRAVYPVPTVYVPFATITVPPSVQQQPWWNLILQVGVGWHKHLCCWNHYSDVIMGAMVSQIASLMIVYLTVYSGADESRVPTRSLFPGNVLTFDNGSLGPGKVLSFSSFPKRSWKSPYFLIKHRLMNRCFDVKYFISLASSLYQNPCFANFRPKSIKMFY